MIDDIGDIDKSESSVSVKSGIPRPTSRPSSRPLTRPTPSARVRALGKDDIEDADEQNSAEDDDDEEEEEEEDEEQAIQVEGSYPIFNAPAYPSPHLHRPATPRLARRSRMGPDPVLDYPVMVYEDDLYLSDGSIGEEFMFEYVDRNLEDERDLLYSRLPRKGAYDPADFEHLSVSSDMKELFQYITRYTPQTIELDHKLRPFIPEYIPAVGDIDAFIKVPRPDGELDKLGLVALDEPCAKQSDPTVLDLQLRAISKETTTKAVAVKKLDNADKRPKEIDAWILSIANLHQSKPPPAVHYAKNMPEVDDLMQEWPAEFESCLNKLGLPTADLDCSLDEYVDVVCGLLDIPVYKSRIQSLHVLFSLYLEFKNSQHFKSLAKNEEIEDYVDDNGSGEELDEAA